MKIEAIASFSIALMLILSPAFAQIDKYDVGVLLDGSKSSVEMSITFAEPVSSYKTNIFGVIRNFEASSTSPYPINCSLNVKEASLINCSFMLTPNNKTISLYFETDDFVRIMDESFYFNGDFTTNENIREMFVTVKLPEGMMLSGAPPHEISPSEVAITSDGRRIVLMWNSVNISKDQPLKFSVLYEATTSAAFPWEYLLIGIAAIGISVFFVLKKIRKPREVILSVLDDHEKNVVNIITASGGEVNQRKVVQETNLSKAKVSRIVKSLVDRGVIESERVGRTNKLRLVKKKFES